MYEAVTLQSWTTTQCLLDWSSIEDHYKTLEHQCILYQVLFCIICVECTERATKEKNNDRIERGHAEEREKICIPSRRYAFPDLKAGHVEHLLTCIFFKVVFAFIVLLFIVYFSTYICFPIFLSFWS